MIKGVFMKIRKVLAIVFMLFFVAIIAFSAPVDTVVYITKSGKMYHRGNCPTLRQSKIETTLDAAVKQGLSPCSRCNPPTLDKE